MKKYKNYIILTVVLLAVAVFLYVKDKPGTLKTDPKIFAVTDTSAVTKIKINSGSTRLTLERSGNNWEVNSSFHARPRAVKALLYLLSNLTISSPVPKSAKQEIVKDFNTHSVLITIESSGQELKSYRITEEDSLKLGTIMVLKGDEEPYVVRLPGFDGRISLLLPIDANIWRDKTIFSYKPGDILSVDIDYGGNPVASFTYSFFGVNDIQVKSKNSNKSVKISQEVARNYLNSFASVTYLEQIGHQPKLLFDSLKAHQPYCEIRVKDNINMVSTIKTYRIPQQKGKFNVDKMYAVIQADTIPVLIKYVDFDPIMKEYNDFVIQ